MWSSRQSAVITAPHIQSKEEAQYQQMVACRPIHPLLPALRILVHVFSVFTATHKHSVRYQSWWWQPNRITQKHSFVDFEISIAYISYDCILPFVNCDSKNIICSHKRTLSLRANTADLRVNKRTKLLYRKWSQSKVFSVQATIWVGWQLGTYPMRIMSCKPMKLHSVIHKHDILFYEK